MASDDFFTQLPVLKKFSDVSDASNFREIPPDWHVVIADIVDSTGAIEKGLYKEVNMVGVAVITSVSNLTRPASIPLVFGGDGASLCIPQSLVEPARQALIGVRMMARRAYSLQLRAGIVPVSLVVQAGYRVLVARHRVSDHYIQAAFTGGGIEFAERLIKDEVRGATYRLEDITGLPRADLSGLECRWDHIPSRHGETIALLVKVLEAPDIPEEAVYREVFATLHRIYGDEEVCSPVDPGQLHLTLNRRKLSVETRARVFPGGWLQYSRHWLLLRIQTILGGLLMTLGISVGGVRWGRYKNAVAANTDFRKFDGMLREVLAGTAGQREQLTAYLERCLHKRKLVYGIHASPSALMTCLINDRSGQHFHFVDGSNGGYAMAALDLKRRAKAIHDK